MPSFVVELDMNKHDYVTPLLHSEVIQREHRAN